MQQASTAAEQQAADGVVGVGKAGDEGTKRQMTVEEILMSPTHGDSNDEEKRG